MLADGSAKSQICTTDKNSQKKKEKNTQVSRVTTTNVFLQIITWVEMVVLSQKLQSLERFAHWANSPYNKSR